MGLNTSHYEYETKNTGSNGKVQLFITVDCFYSVEKITSCRKKLSDDIDISGN